jgi:hypothetical protein
MCERTPGMKHIILIEGLFFNTEYGHFDIVYNGNNGLNENIMCIEDCLR